MFHKNNFSEFINISFKFLFKFEFAIILFASEMKEDVHDQVTNVLLVSSRQLPSQHETIRIVL